MLTARALGACIPGTALSLLKKRRGPDRRERDTARARALRRLAQWFGGVTMARFKWSPAHFVDACSKNGPNGYDVDKILDGAGQPVRAGQRINSAELFSLRLQPPSRWRPSHLVSAASCGIPRLSSGASRASQPRPVRTVRSRERNTDDANARFPCSLPALIPWTTRQAEKTAASRLGTVALGTRRLQCPSLCLRAILRELICRAL